MKGDCVAIDGSKFKADNKRYKNFTKGKIASRTAHLVASIEHYLDEMVRIDRQEEGEARVEKIANLAATLRANPAGDRALGGHERGAQSEPGQTDLRD